MASLENKLEMRGEQEAPVSETSQQPTMAPSSIQIPLAEELQETLIDVILDDFSSAEEARNQKDYGITDKGEGLRFDEWFKRMNELYSGYRQPKTIPWKFCSNRSLRIATSILDMMHSRLYPAVWNEDLCRWRPGTFIDTPKAERISKFMDWWVRVWAPLRSFYDGWVKYVSGFGDALTESGWDVEEMVTSEQIEIPVTDEMGQPLVQDGIPSMIKQPKINRIEKTKSRFITKDNVYMLKGARDVQKDPIMIKETYLFKELEDMEKRGICINVTDKLEKLIHVPTPSGNIDDKEKERLRRVKLRNMPVEIIRWYGHYDVDGVGLNESVRMIVCKEHRCYLGGVRMRDITKSGKRPLDFTKYDSYLQRPEELDGEGVLHKVFELANEMDAIFNQMTDAHTLAVLRPFFYDPSGDLDAAAITLGPNKGVPVTDPQKNVYFPDYAIPTERLINAIGLVQQFIERLTAASEYVMGRESGIVGGSGTATRTNAIIQSAEIRFTLPSERLRAGAARILNNHLDLIQLNIPPGFEQRVLGEGGEQLFQAGELTSMGLTGEYSAYLLPDPSMGSKQTERDMMGQIYSILTLNPIVGSDPQKLYMLTYDYLKSLGKDEAYITRWLGPVPNPDMISDPNEENTLMLRGEFSKVVPQIQENHLDHIQKHMDMQKSPNFQALTATAPELTTQITEYNQLHVQQHMEMLSTIMGMLNKQGGGSSGQSSGATGQGASPDTEGNGGPRGNENIAGPMGEALDSQRAGESSGSQDS